MAGSAQYQGFAIGNVLNGNQTYLATGTLSKSWDFGARTGTISISNFDGANYTGTTVGGSTPAGFVGTVANGAAGAAARTGSVAGGFFAGPGAVGARDPAAAVGGKFSVREANSATQLYRVQGTFGGARR
jgi:hypothetical protein